MESLADKISKCLGLAKPILLQKKVGKSDLGTLYQIIHPQYGMCALKFLEGRIRKDTKYLRRFLSFIQLVKHTRHPNFATIRHVHDKLEFFIIRELVNGDSLEQKIQTKQLTPPEVTKIIIKVANGLEALANNKIIHKNLKPNNIILTSDGGVKITDFCLPPSIPQYLSPEQCQGKASNITSDIYALGIIYYYSLTGQAPFQKNQLQEIINCHLYTPLPPLRQFYPYAPNIMMQILEKMTHKEPLQRYASYQELMSDLEKIFPPQNIKTTHMSAEHSYISGPITLPANNNIISPMPLTTMVKSIEPPSELTLPPNLQKTIQQPYTTDLQINPSITIEFDTSLTNMLDQPQTTPTSNSNKNIQTTPTSNSNKNIQTTPTSNSNKNIQTTPISNSNKNIQTTPTFCSSGNVQENTNILSTATTGSGSIKLPITMIADQNTTDPDKIPDNMARILEQLTNLEQYINNCNTIPRRSVYFPKIYQSAIIQYLYEKFHRECWLIKELDNEQCEVEIDFEQVVILYYLHQFEEQVELALQKLKDNPTSLPQPAIPSETEAEPMQDTILLNESAEFSRVGMLPNNESQQQSNQAEKLNSADILDTSQHNSAPNTKHDIAPSPTQETVIYNPSEQKTVVYQQMPMPVNLPLPNNPEETCTDQQKTVVYQQMPMPVNLPLPNNLPAFSPTQETVIAPSSTIPQETVIASTPITQETLVCPPNNLSENSVSQTPRANSFPQEIPSYLSQPNANQNTNPDTNQDYTGFAHSTFHGITNPELEIRPVTTHFNPKRLAQNTHLDIEVDFNNRHQKLGWFKFIRENELQQNVHFQLIENDNHSENKIFRIQLNWLLDYSKQQDNIYAIKQFFQSDYKIHELGKGGMGIILKLTTRHNATILALRPENNWARKYFAETLHTRRGQNNQEIVYAELPANTRLVVKVAFKDYEESLIQESRSLAELSQDKIPSEWIIGLMQQGHLTAFHTNNESSLGYYMMMEYASQGTAETLYTKFPDNHVTLTVAMTILYGMGQALAKLKQHAIIHRDIKPQNILFDERGMPKLSDFGLAITTDEGSPGLTEDRKRMLRLLDNEFGQISRQKEQLEKKLITLREQYNQFIAQNNSQAKELEPDIQTLTQQFTHLESQEKQRAEALKDRYRPMSAGENAMRGQFAGSLYYAAPEQFETDCILTPQCDVYQLGAVIYTLCTGQRPVEGETMPEIISKVVYLPKPAITELVPGDALWNNLSKLINEMMDNSPESRLTIEQVNEQIAQMLNQFKLEFQQMAHFASPDTITHPKEYEEYLKKVKFAKRMHSRCIEILDKYFYHHTQEDQHKYIFTCPQCLHRLHFYRYMQGKTGHCPHCHRLITVQLPNTK